MFEDAAEKKEKKKGLVRQGGRQGDSGEFVWIHTGAGAAFNMAASCLGEGEPHIVIALIPHWQKVSTSPGALLHHLHSVLQQRAHRITVYVATILLRYSSAENRHGLLQIQSREIKTPRAGRS